MYVCLCEALDDRAIDAAIARGCRTVADLARDCGAGGDCGACCVDLARRLRARSGRNRAAPPGPDDLGVALAAK
ncbi:(2Fe-2S)-binding protein [Myxococcota bacterium]|nr:(2Fe-2S)-binding protein [Myxococcota bacterium]